MGAVFIPQPTFLFAHLLDAPRLSRVRPAAPSIAQQIALQKDCQNRYMALFEDSATETNIYVARDHPSVAEVRTAFLLALPRFGV